MTSAVRLAVALACTVLTLVGCAAPTGPAKPAAPAGAPPPGGAGAAPGAAGAAPTAAAAASAPAARSVTPETVNVGHIGITSDVYTYIGIERGYFQEVGINPELVQFDTAARMVAPLGTGQLDVGNGTPSAGLYNALAKDVDIRVVADNSRVAPSPSHYLVAARRALVESGELREFPDLRGKRIGFNGIGSANEADAARMLARGGLTPQDADMKELFFPDMPPALASNGIDVVLIIEPLMTIVERQGIAVRWKDVGEVNPNHEVALLMFGQRLIHDRGDLGNAYLTAYLRALRDFHRAFWGDKSNQEAVIEVLTKYTNIKDPDLYRSTRPHGVDPNGRINVQSMVDDADWFWRNGHLQQPVDVRTVIDERYLAVALSRLGEQGR